MTDVLSLARAEQLAALLEDYHRFSLALVERGIFGSAAGHCGACYVIGDIRQALRLAGGAGTGQRRATDNRGETT